MADERTLRPASGTGIRRRVTTVKHGAVTLGVAATSVARHDNKRQLPRSAFRVDQRAGQREQNDRGRRGDQGRGEAPDLADALAPRKEGGQ